MATLNLPDCEPTAVWRLVKDRLRADAALSAAGVELLFFDGTREATADDFAGGPRLVFLATLGQMAWFAEGSFSGALVVAYKAVLDGLDDEDALNLFGALRSALYPAGGGDDFRAALVDAGAVTGDVEFPAPVNLPPLSSAGKAGVLVPDGRFVVAVEQRLNF